MVRLALLDELLRDAGLQGAQCVRKCLLLEVLLGLGAFNILQVGEQPLVQEHEPLLVSLLPVRHLLLKERQLLVNL